MTAFIFLGIISFAGSMAFLSMGKRGLSLSFSFFGLIMVIIALFIKHSTAAGVASASVLSSGIVSTSAQISSFAAKLVIGA